MYFSKCLYICVRDNSIIVIYITEFVLECIIYIYIYMCVCVCVCVCVCIYSSSEDGSIY